eukprot:gene30884-40195_t
MPGHGTYCCSNGVQSTIFDVNEQQYIPLATRILISTPIKRYCQIFPFGFIIISEWSLRPHTKQSESNSVDRGSRPRKSTKYRDLIRSKKSGVDPRLSNAKLGNLHSASHDGLNQDRSSCNGREWTHTTDSSATPERHTLSFSEYMQGVVEKLKRLVVIPDHPPDRPVQDSIDHSLADNPTGMTRHNPIICVKDDQLRTYRDSFRQAYTDGKALQGSNSYIVETFNNSITSTNLVDKKAPA